jgi:hypothetical protein
MGGTRRSAELVSKLASAIYRNQRCQRYLLMLELHVDDSGTFGGPHCFLAGYLAPAEKWISLSEEWQNLQEKHLAGEPLILESSHRPEDRWNVEDSTLIAFAECAVKFAPVELWVAFPDSEREKFEQLYEFRFDKYRTSLLSLIESARGIHGGEPIAWFFKRPGDIPTDSPTEQDEMKARYSLMQAFRDMLRETPDKRVLHSFGWVSYADTPPLQAAHLLATMKRRYHTEPLDARTHPAYVILRDAPLRRVASVLFDHKLKDLLDRIDRKG